MFFWWSFLLMAKTSETKRGPSPCFATMSSQSPLVLAYSQWSLESWAARHRGNTENQKRRRCEHLKTKYLARRPCRDSCHQRIMPVGSYCWIPLDSLDFWPSFASAPMLWHSSPRIQGTILWHRGDPLSVSSFWTKQRSKPTHPHILQRNFHWPSSGLLWDQSMPGISRAHRLLQNSVAPRSLWNFSFKRAKRGSAWKKI